MKYESLLMVCLMRIVDLLEKVGFEVKKMMKRGLFLLKKIVKLKNRDRFI